MGIFPFSCQGHLYHNEQELNFDQKRTTFEMVGS
jgi:hypothetical protein